MVSFDAFVVNRAFIIGDKAKIEPLINDEKMRLRSKVKEKKSMKDDVKEHVEVLWDDGYGTKTIKDYLEISKEMIR